MFNWNRYLLVLVIFAFVINLAASNAGTFKSDTLNQNRRESNVLKKEDQREELRKSHNRFIFETAFVYAKLTTQTSFELPSGWLTAKVGLEENLSLPGKRGFLSCVFIFRATPRSGLYLRYYGINRSKTFYTKNDFIFLRDTIPAGTYTNVYFNTQVISGGYLLSILKDPKSFLGAYFNVYLLILNTGVKSEIGNINERVELLAPLPNFGLVAMFRLAKWVDLNANVGFFSLYTPTFGGSIYELNVGLNFKPIRWLGLTLSYQEFDIRVFFPAKYINTVVEYNFRGPALGLKVNF